MAKVTKMTLDALASEMRQGFKHLDRKIDSVEKKFSQKIEIEIGELALATKKGFDDAEEKMSRLDQGVSRVETDVRELKDEFRSINVERRLRRIEYKVGISKLAEEE